MSRKEELIKKEEELHNALVLVRDELDAIEGVEKTAEYSEKYSGRYFKREISIRRHRGEEPKSYWVYFYIKEVLADCKFVGTQIGTGKRGNKIISIEELDINEWILLPNWNPEEIFQIEITKEEYSKAFREEVAKLRIHGDSIFDK